MNDLSYFEASIKAQKSAGNLFSIGMGILLLISTIICPFSKGGRLTDGWKMGSIVCAFFIGIGGIAYKNTETHRMAKVVKEYPIYQVVFATFIVLGILVVLFVKNHFWHGVAFAVILLFAGVVISEAFSHRSIKTYPNYFMENLKK